MFAGIGQHLNQLLFGQPVQQNTQQPVEGERLVAQGQPLSVIEYSPHYQYNAIPENPQSAVVGEKLGPVWDLGQQHPYIAIRDADTTNTNPNHIPFQIALGGDDAQAHHEHALQVLSFQNQQQLALSWELYNRALYTRNIEDVLSA